MRLLIVSHDIIEERMAGPAIRCWELAKVLSRTFEVTLASPGQSTLRSPDFYVENYDAAGRRLADLLGLVDVAVVSGYLVHKFPFLKATDLPLVVDIYDPFLLENLELHSIRDLSEQAEIHTANLAILNELLQAGDFFICASERQRAYWLGMLSALNRVNPLTYREDKSLRKLIGVVPFGLPAQEPRHEKNVLKGVHRTIGPEDKLVLWGGGIYNWLDPLTLLRAMDRIVRYRNDVKLFFMGVRHPSPHVYMMQMCSQAVQLSRELGLYEESVFFNDWVPYEERQNYLLEADVGVSLHLDHIETIFSFRTRVLDYIWARLPMVVTRGDEMSELVERHSLGRVIDYQDRDRLVVDLLEMLDTPRLRQVYAPSFEEVRGQLAWSRVVEPLVEFCRSPRKAPDKSIVAGPSRETTQFPSTQTAVKPTPWRGLFVKAWRCCRDRGLRALREETRNYLKWWRTRRGL